MFGRLLPGIRMPLFLTAGIMRLPFMRFLLADGIGAILGNSIYANGGLGILADPVIGNRQNDVVTYGLSLARAISEVVAAPSSLALRSD